MATVTKKRRVDSVSPPGEIREDTKKRRAWLAAKVAELELKPGISTRIVGQGSYQSITVYQDIEVAGRIRHRGICQYCGNSQVVQDGVMVLHGYQRPGDGRVYGECPGKGEKPLQHEKRLTVNWYENNAELFTKAKKVEEERRLAEADALHALYKDGEALERNAYQAQPKEPVATWRKQPTDEEKKEYQKAMNEWAKLFPLHHTYHLAQERYRAAREERWVYEKLTEHFKRLLDSNTYGQPLTEEFVQE
jgi:hypothetical protein